MGKDVEAPIGSNFQRSQTLSCCPCSRYMAKCIRSCSCKQRAARCSSCGPLSFGRCRNCGALDTALPSHPAQPDSSLVSTDGGRSSGCPCPNGVNSSGQHAGDTAVGPHQEDGANDTFLREKFAQAFGTPLLNHNGGSDCEVCSLWWNVVVLRGRQYLLPDGGIGTRFVNTLSEEIERCMDGRQKSK